MSSTVVAPSAPHAQPVSPTAQNTPPKVQIYDLHNLPASIVPDGFRVTFTDGKIVDADAMSDSHYARHTLFYGLKDGRLIRGELFNGCRACIDGCDCSCVCETIASDEGIPVPSDYSTTNPPPLHYPWADVLAATDDYLEACLKRAAEEDAQADSEEDADSEDPPAKRHRDSPLDELNDDYKSADNERCGNTECMF